MTRLATTLTESFNSECDLFETRTQSGRLAGGAGNPEALAKFILANTLRFRRAIASEQHCGQEHCASCAEPHLQKVVSAISQKRPISFVLPAFPGKSPNPSKVLGPLPDLAEKRALQFLNNLCEELKAIHPSGARIILCSDGRVFSDIVGMREDDVTAYQNELDEMIADAGLSHLSTFNLDELSVGRDFVQVRQELMEQHGQPLETLRERVRRGGMHTDDPGDREAHRMYCGITRFLFEDSLHPGQTKSRTSIQKDCRNRAYEVIRRSNAWSGLIAERFPDAVRMSIHPQACGSAKLGIQLLGTQSWMTPWHGVAVESARGIVLMKRWEAEESGFKIVRDAKGRASHYQAPQLD